MSADEERIEIVIREIRVISGLMKDLLILELNSRGVPQNTLKKIIGVSTNRVNEILKHTKPKN